MTEWQFGSSHSAVHTQTQTESEAFKTHKVLLKRQHIGKIIFFTSCKVIGIFATRISAEYFLRYDRLTWNSLCLFFSQVRFIKIVQ